MRSFGRGARVRLRAESTGSSRGTEGIIAGRACVPRAPEYSLMHPNYMFAPPGFMANEHV